MESELITKVLAGGGGATAAIWVLYYTMKKNKEDANEFKKDVKETLAILIAKFDKLTDSINALALASSDHAKDLEYGDKRFAKIEEELALLRKSHHDIRNKIHDVKNSMITHQQVRDIIESK